MLDWRATYLHTSCGVSVFGAFVETCLGRIVGRELDKVREDTRCSRFPAKPRQVWRLLRGYNSRIATRILETTRKIRRSGDWYGIDRDVIDLGVQRVSRYSFRFAPIPIIPSWTHRFGPPQACLGEEGYQQSGNGEVAASETHAASPPHAMLHSLSLMAWVPALLMELPHQHSGEVFRTQGQGAWVDHEPCVN